jgi:cell shape-determining protein MreC
MKTILRKSPQYFQEIMGVLALVIVMSLMELVGWLSSIKPVVELLLLPASRTFSTLIIGSTTPAIHFGQMISRPNQLRELEQSYAVALSQLSELDQLRRENLALREMLENTDRTLTKKLITAPIVSLSVPAIAAGQQDGVLPGSQIGARGVLLGVVQEVSVHQSTVKLLSGHDSAPVLVQTEKGVQGLVEGNGQEVILTQIPREEVIASGQRVVTLGQPGIAGGLLVGTIGEIITSDSAPVQSAIVNQLVSFYELSIVEVW